LTTPGASHHPVRRETRNADRRDRRALPETHNWSKTAEFFQALGYELDFETDRNSGLLRNGDSPWIFVAEVPEGQAVATQIALKVADADAFNAAPLDVVTPFKETHWGTREMVIRDPDGSYGACKHPAKTEPPRRSLTRNTRSVIDAGPRLRHAQPSFAPIVAIGLTRTNL
jgi:hypothetical protein